MFDQTIFLRRFALGDIPKVLLYAIMALGIRYAGQHPFLPDYAIKMVADTPMRPSKIPTCVLIGASHSTIKLDSS
jgi:hypothetical protein